MLYVSWLTSAGCLFFLSFHPVSFFLFFFFHPVCKFSFLLPLSHFHFLLACRVFTFISSPSASLFNLVDLCYSFSLQKRFLFSKTMVGPLCSLRLLLDSLLEGRRSSSWCCRWTWSSQVTSSPKPFLSATDFSKIFGCPFYHSVREGRHTRAHTCIQNRV